MDDNDHFLDVPNARPISTVGYAAAQEAIREAAAELAISVIHGPAGTGKTFALSRACRKPPLPLVAMTFQRQMRPKRVMQTLLKELTGVLHEETVYRLTDDVVELLSEEPRLVMVDEAQHLNRDCVELLRHAWDHPATKFGLVLAGGNGCWETITNHAMLVSRVYAEVEFKPMDIEDVLEVVPLYHPIYADAEEGTIRLIDRSYCRGNFRSWAVFTKRADAMVREQGRKTVNQEIVRAVLSRLPKPGLS